MEHQLVICIISRLAKTGWYTVQALGQVMDWVLVVHFMVLEA